LETDKVSTELSADTAGVLKIAVPAGTEVAIGAVVGSIVEGAAAAAPARETPAAAAPVPVPAVEKAESVAAASPAAAPVVAAPAPAPAIVMPAAAAAAPARPEEAAVRPSADRRTTRTRLSPLRRKIATHLVAAQQTAAILTTFNEADMSAVMTLRKQLQDSFVARHGLKLGFMSFFVKAVVDALKSVPQINARLEGDELIQNHFYDIGVAVGTEKGLVVPVIRDCDTKSFADIEQAIAEAAKKARDGKLVIDDLQGGVFTISNGGIYGSLLSTPILNPPQSGILGMHTIQERPVAVNGQVVIRPMMYLALSYDHRVVDGKEAVTFLVRVKECLENPARLLLGA
jgi:2-oxoglutarate dehydrogenase E2 component (dihydrolipoamide succinyltransferase)